MCLLFVRNQSLRWFLSVYSVVLMAAVVAIILTAKIQNFLIQLFVFCICCAKHYLQKLVRKFQV